jgi:Skp family chaperone for outer membrane proteins
MKRPAFLLTLPAFICCAYAQQTPQVYDAFNSQQPALNAHDKLPAMSGDTAAIVPAGVKDTPPSPPGSAQLPAQRSLKKGFAVGGTQEDLLEDLPEGTLAVYIDIEEAFNKNPWTLQARRNLRLELETRQLEYARMQEQLKELLAKENNLNQELFFYKPYYERPQYIEAAGSNAYPKIKTDPVQGILDIIAFGPADRRVASPENTPEKLEQIKENIRDTKKAVIEKESFLLNYKEFSKEEALSKQDAAVQEILKEIYSGIKEYAKVRNIGLVVDKKDLIYGKPLNVTGEFVKWMKTYHKKYIKEHGDLQL